MKKFFALHPFVRKLFASLVIVLVFLLGRHIPLPRVSLTDYVHPLSNHYFYMATNHFSQISVFSLGLGPMMYGMLLSQLFLLGKKSQAVSPKIVEFRKNLLVLVVAIIQGLSFAIGLSYGDVVNPLSAILEVTMVLVAGAFIILWLSHLNTAFGIGGPMLLMLVSIIANQFGNLPLVIHLWKTSERFFLIAFVGWVLITIYLIVLFDKSEYRIPLQRISIHNKYSEHSYLPIRVNVAGGMAIMYAYTFLSFPTYILLLLGWAFPQLNWVQAAIEWFNPRTFSGVLFYCVMIAVLTILLAFLNVDVVQLTEGLRNTGDYIPYVRPGRPTREYIARYVRFFAYFNAIYLIILAGIPMIVGLYRPALQPLAGMIGVIMMTAGILLQVLEELHVMTLKKQYQTLFD